MRPGYLLLVFASVALGVTATSAGATTMTDNGEPFKAGVFTSFGGFLLAPVPEPATWTILLTGLAATGALRRRYPFLHRAG